jgi:hypothetical protein
MRKQCTSPLSPEARIKQDQLHQITLQRIRITLLLDEGLKSKYVIGSDEFGMLLFPQGQYRWAKIGSKEVKVTALRVYLMPKCNRNTHLSSFLSLPTIGRISQPK